MNDFLHNLMHPLPNAVMTVMMGVLVIYWLFTLLSGAGMDSLDLGFDFDADIDVDVDAPVIDVNTDTPEADHDVAGDDNSPSFLMKFLNFMNVGKVPFMLVLSAFKFFIWIGSLITTKLVDVTSWGLTSLLILIPLAFISIFFTKFATTPLVKFFKEIGYNGEEEIDFMGRSGKMVSNIKGDKIGSAEFVIDKNPIRLNVKSVDGEELKYDDYVIIVDETEDKKTYYVSKEISLRNL